MIEKLLAYLNQFADGHVAHNEFSTVLFLLRDIVEDTNAILDGTCTLKDVTEIQAMIADIARNYADMQLVVSPVRS